jgi:single stranded DNA-binding protein
LIFVSLKPLDLVCLAFGEQASQRQLAIMSSRKGVKNMDYQKLILVGNATKDAETKQPEDKTAYADFTLAVSRTKEQKTFFPIRVFGKLAETCEMVKKGTKVLVEGRLDISEYTDEEGQKKVTFRVLADTYRLLSKTQKASSKAKKTKGKS